MQPTPIQRLHAAVPPALLIGLVLAIVGELARDAYQARCHKAGDGLVAELPTDLPTARIHDPL